MKWIKLLLYIFVKYFSDSAVKFVFSYTVQVLLEKFSTLSRRSRPELFCKKDVPGNFAKFTGKHLYQSLFFSKVAGLRPATLLKKRLWHRCFLVKFMKFPGTPFFIEHLWWLLLPFCDNISVIQKPVD